MLYRRFEYLLPSELLLWGYSNQDIRHAGNTALSRRHSKHKPGLKRREILKITDATALLHISALTAFRRLFIAVVPNVEYLRIPLAIVVYFKEASLHSSWTRELIHKTQASVWIKTNQTEIQIGYFSAKSFRYILLLYRGCGEHLARVTALKEQSFVEVVWRHCSVTMESPGCSKNVSDSCVISRFGPCASRSSPEKKRLIQLSNFHIRDTAGLIVNISSTPVTITYVLPASKYNYSVFNIIQFYSS